MYPHTAPACPPWDAITPPGALHLPARDAPPAWARDIAGYVRDRLELLATTPDIITEAAALMRRRGSALLPWQPRTETEDLGHPIWWEPEPGPVPPWLPYPAIPPWLRYPATPPPWTGLTRTGGLPPDPY